MATTPKKLVDGVQLTASAAVYYTATNVSAIISAFSVTNDDTSTRAITVYLVENGGTASAANLVAKNLAIPAGGTEIVRGALGQVVERSGTIQALADVAAKVALHVSGAEVT